MKYFETRVSKSPCCKCGSIVTHMGPEAEDKTCLNCDPNYAPMFSNDTKIEVPIGPSNTRSGCNLYPKVCEFVGVHPNQIPEASRFLEQRGVEPSFNRDGDFCPQSKKHYKQYQKAMGLHENDKKHGRMLKKH